MTTQPIATAPRDGKVIFVARGGTIAKVFWHGPQDPRRGGWCYGHHEAPDRPWHGIDFEPTHWAESSTAFLPADLTPPAT